MQPPSRELSLFLGKWIDDLQVYGVSQSSIVSTHALIRNSTTGASNLKGEDAMFTADTRSLLKVERVIGEARRALTYGHTDLAGSLINIVAQVLDGVKLE